VSKDVEVFIPEYSEDSSIQPSIVRDYWAVLQVMSREKTQSMLQLM
jgi:hypothetical protein